MTLKSNLSSGYSLVELVVVILVLGLIALACESGLHFGVQVWSRMEARANAQANIAMSQAILRSLLSHSLPRTKGDYVTFEGEPTTIGFDLAPPQAFQDGGTAHAQIRIMRTRNSAQLVIEMQSVAVPALPRRAVLLEDVGLMRFAYLDASGQSQNWLSYWRDRNRLPDAIRISAANPKLWPTLIVRPVIVQSATCVLDSAEMGCRKI